jgi:hypothetical protein
VLSVALLGCVGSPTTVDTGAFEPDCRAGPLEVRVGTGSTGFEPLLDGDPIEIAALGRGAFAVIAAGRFDGTDGELALSPSVDDAELGLLGGDRDPVYVALAGHEACTGWYLDTDRGTLRSRCAAGYEPACEGQVAYVCSLAGRGLGLSIAAADLDGERTAAGEVTGPAALAPEIRDACLAAGGT